MTPAPAAVVRAGLAIAARDFVRLARRPAQIIASVATPLLLWVVLVGGLADALPSPGNPRPVEEAPGGYSAYLAPGFALLALVFSTVFASISLIEDRREGILRQVLLSGVHPAALPVAKSLAGGAIAWALAAPLLLARGVISPTPPAGVLLAVVVLALAAVAISALGVALAARCATARAFHGYMNLLLMPAWMLSGSAFPLDTSRPWVRLAATVNPVAWTHGAVLRRLEGHGSAVLDVGVGLAVAAAALVLATLAWRSDAVFIDREAAP